MILHGRNLIITAGGVAIAAAKSCSIDVDAEIIKVASPTDGQWEHSISGRKSWSVATNHFLTSIVDGAEMVGTMVTLRMQINGKVGLPFGGFVNGVVVQSGSQTEVEDIVWDKTSKKFLGVVYGPHFENEYFYHTWNKAYSTNDSSYKYQNEKNFYLTSLSHDVYKKTSTDLILEALQGTAIVKKWQAAGAVGGLATGSFRFEGSGPFTRPTT